MPSSKKNRTEATFEIDQSGILSPKGNYKLLWQPDSLVGQPLKQGKQWEFLTSPEDYVGMDGGKGSGKTDVLIFDCLRPEKVKHPLWHGVIFRREYKRLVEVIDRATYWLKVMPQWNAHWQGDKSRFVFPSGAWLAFHNCETEGDEKQYQGWQICDLKFDQLEEFPETVFNFLCQQNRSGDPVNLHSTVKWTANPIGVGRDWVKRRFVDGKEPGKIYTTVLEFKGKTYIKTYRRIFATVFDNPLLASDEKYIATLAAEPNPYIRKALFEGNWDVVVGMFFNEFAHQVHSISARELDPRFRRIAGCDYGNYKSLQFLARDFSGNVYAEWEYYSAPDEMKPAGETSTEFAENSADFMLKRNIGENIRVVGDNNMWSATGRDMGIDKTPAVIVQQTWQKKFKEAGRKGHPVLVPVSKRTTEEYNYRIACNEAVRDFLHYEIDNAGKITREPRVFFFDRCRALINSISSLITDPSDPMDIANGQNDHAFDAFKMPFMEILPSREPVPKEEIPKNETEYLEKFVFKKKYDQLLNPKRLWYHR